MHRGRSFAATYGGLALAFLCAVGSCARPTSLQLALTTNVPPAASARVAIYAAKGVEVESIGAQAVQETWDSTGNVGTLTVVPKDSEAGEVAVRVVLALGRDPDSCKVGTAQPAGCIVARRRLSFVSGEALTVPVRLHAQCNGVLCDADTTCNALGRCVSARIDAGACARPEGCLVEGDEPANSPAQDAGADTSSIVDASGADATADGATDAPSGDAGPDAGKIVRELSLSEATTCLLTPGLGSGLACWGWNYAGQLGLGNNANVGANPGDMGVALRPVDLGAGLVPLHVAAGASHTCAISTSGKIKCWGYNDFGDLGLGDTERRGDSPGEMDDTLPSIDLGTGETWVGVAVSPACSQCAWTATGRVKCWGCSSAGNLGFGANGERIGASLAQMGNNLPFVDLGAGARAVSVAMGLNHTCALLDSGGVKCWGDNVRGQLGLGDSDRRGENGAGMGNALPLVPLGAGRTVKSLCAGYTSTCVVLDDGNAKCWGSNEFGRLGLGDEIPRGDVPQTRPDNLPAISLGRQATKIAGVGDGHTCALLDNGSIKCWGRNIYGTLGLGDQVHRGDLPGTMGNNLPAVDLGTGRTAVDLAVGRLHACALLDSGALKCWGYNAQGQLGLGDTDNRGDMPNQMGNNLPAVALP